MRYDLIWWFGCCIKSFSFIDCMQSCDKIQFWNCIYMLEQFWAIHVYRQYTFKALICRMNYIFNPIENVVTTSWFIWYIQGQIYKRKMQSAISIEFQSVPLHIYICTWPHSSFGILKCWRRITFRLSRESVRYHHNRRKKDLNLSKKHKMYFHCDV